MLDLTPAEHTPAPPSNSAQAHRLLLAAARAATERLAAAGLDRPDPTIRSALAALAARIGEQSLPRTLAHPDRLVTACRLALIAEVAQRTDGAAVTAGEASARRDPLRELAAAARRAISAAYTDVGTVPA